MFNSEIKTNKDLLLYLLSIVLSSIVIGLLTGLTMYGLFSLTINKVIVYPSIIIISVLFLFMGWLLSEFIYSLIMHKVCKVYKPTISKD